MKEIDKRMSKTDLMESKVFEAEEVQAAKELHNKVIESGKIAEQALVEFAEDLKQMKDTKLYKALGYKTFALYCEQAIGLKSRQVYNYIYVLENNDKEFVHSSAHLGIKKLQLLTDLHNEDKKKFVKEKHIINGKFKTAEEMTTREFQAEVKKQKELYTDNKKNKEVNPKVNDNQKLDEAIKRHQELEQEIKEQKHKIKDIKENILLSLEKNEKYDMSVEFEEMISVGCLGGVSLAYKIYFIKSGNKTLIVDDYLASSFDELDITDRYEHLVFNVNHNEILIQQEKDFILSECLRFRDQALKRDKEVKRQFAERNKRNAEELFGKQTTQFNEEEKKMLKKFYHILSMKFHTDKGGTTEEMILVNKLKEQWGI